MIIKCPPITKYLILEVFMLIGMPTMPPFNKLYSTTILKRYYLAATAKRSLTPARIRQNNLETREKHGYFWNLIEGHKPLQTTSYLDKLWHFLPYDFWFKKLWVDENDEICINYYTPLSSKGAGLLTDKYAYCNSIFFSSQLNYACPNDLLYNIPQNIWDDFVGRLKYPDIADELELSKNRHLIHGYNVCVRQIKNPNYLKLASSIRQFHFLANLLDGSTGFIGVELLTKTDITTALLKGESIFTILRGKKPFFTTLFLQKFAHSVSWYNEVLAIGEKILQKSFDLNKKLDLKKLYEFIAAIPCSVKNPTAFSKMLDDHNIISHFNISEIITSNIFYHQRLNYGELTKDEISKTILLNEYFLALTQDLIFPQYLRLLEKDSELKHTISRYQNNRRELNNLIDKLNDICKVSLSQYPLKKLLNLQNNWQRNLNVMNNEKPPLSGRLQTKWTALFDPISIDGVDFICLNTQSLLKEEGKELDHCVGGYVRDCLSLISHIIRVVSKDSRSTIELRQDSNNNYYIAQHHSYRNFWNTRTPSNLHIKTSFKLLEKINSKSIALNPLKKNDPEDICLEIYPFDFHNTEAQEQIYQAYRKYSALDTAKTYKKMLEQNGIQDLLEAMILERKSKLIDAKSSLPNVYRFIA